MLDMATELKNCCNADTVTETEESQITDVFHSSFTSVLKESEQGKGIR